MRLIDADAMGIDYANLAIFTDAAYAEGWNSAIRIIKLAPTVTDVVKVVRCGECLSGKVWKNRHGFVGITCEIIGAYVEPEDYCSFGERRGGG